MRQTRDQKNSSSVKLFSSRTLFLFMSVPCDFPSLKTDNMYLFLWETQELS